VDIWVDITVTGTVCVCVCVCVCAGFVFGGGLLLPLSLNVQPLSRRVRGCHDILLAVQVGFISVMMRMILTHVAMGLRTE
jgi:hypothetical protein